MKVSTDSAKCDQHLSHAAGENADHNIRLLHSDDRLGSKYKVEVNQALSDSIC